MEYRIEKDSLGEVQVEFERLYGAQTQRSKMNFWAGGELMPREIIRALLWIKRCAAEVNAKLGLLELSKSHAIQSACDQLLEKLPEEEFPLVIWQTGSGTQTNMNVNEVVASLASEYLGVARGKQRIIHPNDDVNKCQSSNDVFPTAMHMATFLEVRDRLQPAINLFKSHLQRLCQEYESTLKVGRTHCMDAAVLTYGDVFGSFQSQIEIGQRQLENAITQLKELALGATAVGTGLNAHPQFASNVISLLNEHLKTSFYQAPNLFCALSGHEPLTGLSASLRTLAVSLLKIGNDIRMLASGPRCGLAELKLPENEPGSSIMPGKVNPTQCESLTMIAVQVLGLDSAVAIASSQGQFELNTFKPLIAHNVLRSIRLLADGMNQFSHLCLKGLKVDEKRASELVNQSLMLATILNEKIGYDLSSKIVRKAHLEGKSLKQAAVEIQALTPEQFDEWIDPRKMLGDKK